MISGCGSSTNNASSSGSKEVLKVAANPVPHAEILEQVKPILAKEGVDLQIVEFTDYIQPNMALSSHEVDANFFANVPYQNNYNKDHGTNFVSFAPVQIPRSIQDLDAAVINANYALPAGLNPTKDGLFVEKADSPYANLLSVNPGDENKPAIQKLAKALQSPEVKKFIEEHYKGAIIPAF